MPQEFSGLPLCDIDPYYEDKKTFMVITGSVGSVNYIYRFSMHNVLVFLSPFHPIHRVAIHMHTSKAFNAILIINTTILANSFHRGVCEDGGDDDGSEGVGGEHIDGQSMDWICQRAKPQQVVLFPLTIFVVFYFPTDHLPVLGAQRSGVPVPVPPSPSPGHQRAHL